MARHSIFSFPLLACMFILAAFWASAILPPSVTASWLNAAHAQGPDHDPYPPDPWPWLSAVDEHGSESTQLLKALEVAATGTGETTNHIANLTITSPADHPETLTISFGPLLIPSEGTHQAYIVPEASEATIAPGQTLTVPVYGYCADIFRPPVPDGDPMPPPADWIGIELIDLGDWKPDPAAGWVAIDEVHRTDLDDVVLIPGTDEPLGHTIDLDNHLAEAGPILLAAVNEIAAAYHELEAEGAIQTPLAGRPEAEKEAVMQHTFWVFTAALTGSAYKLEDFRDNTIEQFEEATGTAFEDAPGETQDQIESGVQDFWNTFSAVGAQAKVVETAQARRRGILCYLEADCKAGSQHGGSVTTPEDCERLGGKSYRRGVLGRCRDL